MGQVEEDMGELEVGSGMEDLAEAISVTRTSVTPFDHSPRPRRLVSKTPLQSSASSPSSTTSTATILLATPSQSF